MAVLMSYKVDFKAKKITRVREGHCVTIKWLIYQEDIVILNMYAPVKRGKTYEAKTNKIERRNRLTCNCRWRL